MNAITILSRVDEVRVIYEGEGVMRTPKKSCA